MFIAAISKNETKWKSDVYERCEFVVMYLHVFDNLFIYFIATETSRISEVSFIQRINYDKWKDYELLQSFFHRIF